MASTGQTKKIQKAKQRSLGDRCGCAQAGCRGDAEATVRAVKFRFGMVSGQKVAFVMFQSL